MAQMGWVFLDDFGGRHRIGLYHGDRSGHVMIHCNLRVVQIDFSVKESRTYSIFIEDELCEVQLFKEHGTFSYAFVVNKTTDTPRNRLRREEDGRNRSYVVLLIAGLCLVIAAIFGTVQWFSHQQDSKRMATSQFNQLAPVNEKRLLKEGKSAVAQLLIVQEDSRRTVYYSFFTADSIRISGKFAIPDTGMALLPNGFPLGDRDAFEIRYLPPAPQTHLIDFSYPEQTTIAAYVHRAIKAEQDAHPDSSPAKNACLAWFVLRERGWPGLADLIFQNTPTEDNAQHNRDSYQRLLREPAFARKMKEECWEE